MNRKPLQPSVSVSSAYSRAPFSTSISRKNTAQATHDGRFSKAASQQIHKSTYRTRPLPPPTSVFHYHFAGPTESDQGKTAERNAFRPSQFDGQLPAYIDGITGQTLSREELKHTSPRLGYALTHSKDNRTPPVAQAGDVIFILSPNSLHYPVIFFACQAALLVPTLCNSSATSRDVAYQLKDSTAKVGFVHPDLVGVWEGAIRILKEEAQRSGEKMKDVPVFLMQSLPRSSDPSPIEGALTRTEGYQSYENLLQPENSLESTASTAIGSWAAASANWKGLQVKESPSQERKRSDVSYDDTAVICYSSGTTGLPKGVMTTHRNLTVMETIFTEALIPMSPENKDAALGLLPFSHIFGLTLVLLHPLTLGIPIVTLPKFTPHTFFSAIESQRISWSFIVPPIVNFLAHFPGLGEKHDLSSLRGFLSGAAPMAGDVAMRAMQRMEKSVGGREFMITQGSGLTETSPATHVLPLEMAKAKIGSIGLLLPTLEARLVDVAGNDVRSDEAGEMVLRGPTIMRIVDRLKEMIKVKGYQVAPAELENLLLSHPDVLDAGVIGVRASDGVTEMPRAFVVPRPGVLATGGNVQEGEGEAKARFEQDVVGWVNKQVSLRYGVLVACFAVGEARMEDWCADSLVCLSADRYLRIRGSLAGVIR
ncbi:hypothetical protein QFC22_002763 [Naganishia vaughanmartiniae]|uniref:Uncharacterized protein n=1 Tax=Naganishia vaughanmartiniae TaxID=1424756 RepID=A0ACC2XBN4_9TREE|nr:hypothetical protein QFC22_002763 [Naganishia vaughanmartiniae]